MVILEVAAFLVLLYVTVCYICLHRRPDFSTFSANDTAVPFQTSGAVAFEVHSSCRQALEATARWAERNGYRTEDLNEPEGRLVLTRSAGSSLINPGFWLIVECDLAKSGNTIVNADVRSRAFLPGFVLALYRDESVRQLRKALRPEGMMVFSWEA